MRDLNYEIKDSVSKYTLKSVSKEEGKVIFERRIVNMAADMVRSMCRHDHLDLFFDFKQRGHGDEVELTLSIKTPRLRELADLRLKLREALSREERFADKLYECENKLFQVCKQLNEVMDSIQDNGKVENLTMKIDDIKGWAESYLDRPISQKELDSLVAYMRLEYFSEDAQIKLVEDSIDAMGREF